VGIHLAAQSALEDLGPTEQLRDFSKITRLIVYRCYHYHLRYTSSVAFKDDMWRILMQAGWTGGSVSFRGELRSGQAAGYQKGFQTQNREIFGIYVDQLFSLV
jgi:hypothetical protein